ncbi:MAG: nitrilase-related carbon-nitrogen hydrolase, partial [Prosthecobacter sp.]|nr:nitrilase-related carbon-nitrogen hydrolase [Prosthecobacter sp.]
PGLRVKSPAAFAAEVTECVETSWDDGADIVLLPEFTWMGLEPLVEPSSLRRVAECFWGELFPTLKSLLCRPDKAVVLGTVPFWDAEREVLNNRAPILLGDRVLHQDKLHLTPWESAFVPGRELRLWEFAGMRFAVVICLDIEIPELSARLRGAGVDVLLVPSATETVLGVERVDRCASARAVELGCVVGVSHLTGKAASELIDENVGRTAVYFPSQAAFRDSPRWVEGEIVAAGVHKQRVVLEPRALERMRRMRQETNPSLLSVLPHFEIVQE